ncbi:unnamed protein product [Cyprideis torosa]|uniref:Uncharacterized protein n=1 Tax=Cyprideis torosa TaxID=163714 RepID=A0A7R8WLN4_9CRUS|nr:unnamed protein product [Cyprideis torosa]CAG0904465.1 unnamed protein product [Cyprideis torosa]
MVHTRSNKQIKGPVMKAPNIRGIQRRMANIPAVERNIAGIPVPKVDISASEKKIADIAASEKKKADIAASEKKVADISAVQKKRAGISAMEKKRADISSGFQTEKKIADIAASEKKVPDISAVEKKSADIAAVQKKSADIAAVQKKSADIAAVQKKSADIAAVQKKSADIAAVEKESTATPEKKESNKIASEEEKTAAVLRSGTSAIPVASAIPRRPQVGRRTGPTAREEEEKGEEVGVIEDSVSDIEDGIPLPAVIRKRKRGRPPKDDWQPCEEKRAERHHWSQEKERDVDLQEEEEDWQPCEEKRAERHHWSQEMEGDVELKEEEEEEDWEHFEEERTERQPLSQEESLEMEENVELDDSQPSEERKVTARHPWPRGRRGNPELEDEDWQPSSENRTDRQPWVRRRRRRGRGRPRKKNNICFVCSKRFTQSRSLVKHMAIHTGVREDEGPVLDRPFPCDHCHKGFSSNENRVAHMRLHTGERPFKCPDPSCPKTFTAKKYADAHLYKVHVEGKGKIRTRKTYSPNASVECDLCAKIFPFPSKLEEHMRKHTGERPFKCQFCDKRFFTQANVKAHENIHTLEVRFQCPACHRLFLRKEAAHRHYDIIHAKVRPYICGICQFRCGLKYDLVKHVMHHARGTSCALCEGAFPDNGMLRLHFREAHLEDCMGYVEDEGVPVDDEAVAFVEEKQEQEEEEYDEEAQQEEEETQEEEGLQLMEVDLGQAQGIRLEELTKIQTADGNVYYVATADGGEDSETLLLSSEDLTSDTVLLHGLTS